MGATVPIESSSDLRSTLQLLLPLVLADRYPESEHERLDGLSLSSAVLTGERVVDLAGYCVLVRDQAVTPFTLTVG